MCHPPVMFDPREGSPSQNAVRHDGASDQLGEAELAAEWVPAAGVDSERVELRDGAGVADALDEVTRRHGAELTRVLARCSFLLDSVAVHDRAAPLPAGAELDVLPPTPAGLTR